MSILEDNEKLNKIYSEYLKLGEKLEQEEIVLDKKLCLKLTKQKALISPIAEKYILYLNAKKSAKEYDELIEIASNEDKTSLLKESLKITDTIAKLTQEILDLLKVYNASNQCIIIEIISPKEENALTLDIVQGYTAYCENNNLDIEKIQEKHKTTFRISGLNAKVFFENEIGIHQDITNNINVQVYVYDNIPTEEITFEDKDLSIITSHASGAGGQHINTTDSAVKITHIKSGISATCQSERSQLQNKEKALDKLKNKVFAYYSQLKDKAIKDKKKEQIKLIQNKYITKTYNYQTNIITTASRETLTLSDFKQGEGL